MLEKMNWLMQLGALGILSDTRMPLTLPVTKFEEGFPKGARGAA